MNKELEAYKKGFIEGFTQGQNINQVNWTYIEPVELPPEPIVNMTSVNELEELLYNRDKAVDLDILADLDWTLKDG